MMCCCVVRACCVDVLFVGLFVGRQLVPERLRAIADENSRNCHNRHAAKHSRRDVSRSETARDTAVPTANSTGEGAGDRVAREGGDVDGELVDGGFVDARTRGAAFVAMWSLAEV
jgi:hypothetical protein